MSNQTLTIPRRNFLKGALALSVTGVLYLPALAEPRKPVGLDRFAFLSDIHIRETPIREVYTPEHFAKNAEQILAAAELPSAAIVCGDCACLTGDSKDYVLLAKSLVPLREAGVPVYLILGNHDDRDALWNAFPDQKGAEGAFDDPKHIKVVSAPNVNLFLLDSKVTGDFQSGNIGKDQLEWIEEKLRKFKDKPAIFMAHHPEVAPSLYEVLKRYPHAKAYFFGHKHEWYHQEDKQTKLWEVCLPASAYVFKEDEPLGWVDAQFHDKGVKLTLNAMDPKHPKQGEVVELGW